MAEMNADETKQDGKPQGAKEEEEEGAAAAGALVGPEALLPRRINFNLQHRLCI